MIYLGIGSNLGNRGENIRRSLCELSKIGRIVTVSGIYRTDPYGVTDQPEFLNLTLSFQTQLSPLNLLDAVKEIEKKMGRVERGRWRERIIDIDILFYHDEIFCNDELTLPHPDLQNRVFVLRPICDIAPNFVHPVSKKSMRELLNELCETDSSDIADLDKSGCAGYNIAQQNEGVGNGLCER